MFEPTTRAKRASVMIELDKGLDEPPPYIAQAPSETPSLSPPPQIKDTLDFKPSFLEIPTATQCFTHLKLLHALSKLRHDIGNQEGLFGIGFDKIPELVEATDSNGNNEHQPAGVHGEKSAPSAPETKSTESDKPPLAERIRDKRWTVFVTRAADRFEKFWENLIVRNETKPLPIRTIDFDTITSLHLPSRIYEGNGYDSGAGKDFELPPLDVLMVWHAYMLNPRAYFEDCIRLNKELLWQTPFPWESISKAIDDETYTYNPSQEDMALFDKTSGVPWDPLEDKHLKAFPCPKCKVTVTVPWTRPPDASTIKDVEFYLAHDTGFSGDEFNETCSTCGLLITHETLRVNKFINDAEALLRRRRPLPGTLLGFVDGLPEMSGVKKRISTHDLFFPNRIVECFPEFQPDSLRAEIDGLTIKTLKVRFHQFMLDQPKLKIVNAGQHRIEFLAKSSKIAIRKMLSRYWDNSSPFALDLVGAVVRQSSFIQKMVKINWIRSPAALATLQRLIIKYHRFIRIIAQNPRNVAVPTLDVDLAWHTHQLRPQEYLRYSVGESTKFIDHDDKIPEVDLHRHFQWTCLTYEKKYGQPYSECACWYCECTREPLRSSFSNRIFSTSKQCNVDLVAEQGLPKDPFSGVHLSSHNAIIGGPQWAALRRKELEDLDLQYAKVCKRYQKKKKAGEPPARHTDAYVASAYGYPMYYPMYVPYYGEPTLNAETRAQGHTGAAGGCASGTCATSTSLGSCANGAGVPVCASSCGGAGTAAGGCGSGGACGGGGGGGCGGS